MVSPASGRGLTGAAGATACSVVVRTSAGAGEPAATQKITAGTERQEDHRDDGKDPPLPAGLRLERSLPLVELEVVEIGHRPVYTCTLDG